MADSDSGLRADARANRDRILAIARDAFAADPSASLNAIAKAARVGAGTLYRHFSSRETLLVGVYRQEIDTLVALAPALLGEHPPIEAFQRWCARFAAFGSVKHGIADSLRAAVSEADLQDTYPPLVEAMRQLIGACERHGAVRPGIDPEDVLALLSCVLRIAPTTDGKARVKRVLDLIFKSIRAGYDAPTHVAVAPEKDPLNDGVK